MYTSDDDQASKFVKARDRITDVTSPESYKLALQCLQNCVDTHEKCPKPQSTILPDRVIDCSDTKRARIVLTRGTKGFYATLSYVWGGPQPMTTTKNIDEYVKQGFEVSKFPQTIQDAIVATHSLGQRYLWIDALCIIQDSDEDRSRQLGMMHDIYRNAYITLNAACGSGVKEGFLHRKRPAKIPNTRIPYRCPDGTLGSVWIAAQMDTDIADGSHSYFDEIEPVTYRAWCLQERLLAARSFIYATDTLKFYCQTETVNIGHALCEPSTGMRLPNSVYRPPVGGTAISDKDQVANRQAWLAVIFMYTLREISVPSDKLVALAGVAEQFQHVYNDKYLAGLWQKTLIFDLLWSCGPQGFKPRPKYRAPTWSWASIDGLVSAKYHEGELSPAGLYVKKVDILECKVKLANEKLLFGEVTGGVLKLMGFMKDVSLQLPVKPTNKVFTSWDGSNKAVEIGQVTRDTNDDMGNDFHIIPILWDSRGGLMEGLVVTWSVNEKQYKRRGLFTGSKEAAKDILRWMETAKKQTITLI
ncbi:hypothetical protein M422DRAFT_222588 [Sphaerobolus stellatus SS14]|nr:hypothetical protein M422DRAFT_222588 [Sphaerobolus stellatus SS14]